MVRYTFSASVSWHSIFLGMAANFELYHLAMNLVFSMVMCSNAITSMPVRLAVATIAHEFVHELVLHSYIHLYNSSSPSHPTSNNQGMAPVPKARSAPSGLPLSSQYISDFCFLTRTSAQSR